MKRLLSIVLVLVFCGNAWGAAPAWGADPALHKAMDLAYNAQFDQAKGVLNSYIAGHPGDPLGYIVRGTALDWEQLVTGKKTENQALADYQLANKQAFLIWEKDEENIDKMVTLGNSYLFLSKKWMDLKKKSRAGLILKKCQKHMEEAIRRDPKRWDAYLAIGIFNFYAANIPPGLQFIASLLGISGDEATGIRQLQNTANNPNLFQNHALFILTHAFGQQKKNYGMVKPYLDRLIARFPGNPHFIFLMGEYAYRGKQPAASRAPFNMLFNFCRTHSCNPRYLFMANYLLAAGYVEEEKMTDAWPYVEEASRLNTDQFKDRTIRLHYYRGVVLNAQGKTSAALKEFEFVRANQGKNPKAWELTKKELKKMGKE